MRSYRDSTREGLLRDQYNHELAIWVSAIEQGVSTGEFQPKLPIETIARTTTSFLDGLYCDGNEN